MLTGRKPYIAETPAAILLKQATEPLPRPSQYARGLPEAVEKILIKALARNPKDRYEDIGAFARALENTTGEAQACKLRLSQNRARTQQTPSQLWIRVGMKRILKEGQKRQARKRTLKRSPYRHRNAPRYSNVIGLWEWV